MNAKVKYKEGTQMTETDFRAIYVDWKKGTRSEDIAIKVITLVEVFLFLMVPVFVGLLFSWEWGILSFMFAAFIFQFYLVAMSEFIISFPCSSFLTEEDSVNFFEKNADFVGYLAILREHGEIRPIFEYEKAQLVEREHQLKETKNKSRYSLMYKEMFEKASLGARS